MSKLEVRTFEEQIRGAGIAGELERAEQKGYDNGCAQTERKFISKLLKNYSPSEVCEMFDFPMGKILKIIEE